MLFSVREELSRECVLSGGQWQKSSTSLMKSRLGPKQIKPPLFCAETKSTSEVTVGAAASV